MLAFAVVTDEVVPPAEGNRPECILGDVVVQTQLALVDCPHRLGTWSARSAGLRPWALRRAERLLRPHPRLELVEAPWRFAICSSD